MAIGAYFFELSPQAEKRVKSSHSKKSSLTSCMIFSQKGVLIIFPADFSEAPRRSSLTGICKSKRQAIISIPTAQVAHSIQILYINKRLKE